jgi:hypothetical protein
VPVSISELECHQPPAHHAQTRPSPRRPTLMIGRRRTKDIEPEGVGGLCRGQGTNVAINDRSAGSPQGLAFVGRDEVDRPMGCGRRGQALMTKIDTVVMAARL